MEVSTDVPPAAVDCCGLLSLPAEVRVAILEYVFDDNIRKTGMKYDTETGALILDERYSSNDCLQALLVCRTMYQDGSILGMKKTTFVMFSLFGNIPDRSSVLHIKQVEAIRHIAFVADARQFRKLVDWGQHPFDMPSLRLDTLTIVLHSSSFWHYLFDFTPGVVKLLRNLKGVRRILMIRNNARVKGSFRTWYNRLVGLIMKVDHHERYERCPPNPEAVWWSWSFDEKTQSLCLEAQPPKPLMEEETYMQTIKPLMERLRLDVENEEWNPDPRSRFMYY